MDAGIYAAVAARAGRLCECGCGEAFGGGMASRATLDHFRGRKNAESVESCWFLRWDHHEAKGSSRPDAATWVRKFIAHCGKHGYVAEKEKALTRLEVLKTKFPEKKK